MKSTVASWRLIRDWRKYHNRQLYCECQLVTALNAHYYLTGKQIEQDSKAYEAMVDLCSARNGSALNIHQIHEALGIEPDEVFKTEAELTLHFFRGQIHLPLEVSVWHHHYGFHSVLVVDYHRELEAIRVTNFDRATSSKGWIFMENFQYYVKGTNNGWIARTFKKVKSKPARSKHERRR